ncbi:MAG: hypothetical protein V4813_13155 [Gemmatimonadota bacterium]
MRDTVYVYRLVFLPKRKVSVPNVLVGVCRVCDETVSLPAQSTPRIAAVHAQPVTEHTVRIPLELEDRLHMIASAIGSRLEPFTGAVCRYALSQFVSDRQFARLICTQATSGGTKGTPGGRLTFRADALLVTQARAVARDAGIRDLSTLLRGAILALEALLASPEERAALEHDLRLLAIASGS